MVTKKDSAYAAAGVDIDGMVGALARAKRGIRKTATPGVVSDIGSFGGLFASPGSDHLLVSSIDGVGTKLKVAHMAGRHDTVGQDLVNHCVNDILVQGASPLFFMDYVGTAKLNPGDFAGVLRGLCKACRENGCALIGGETAEMPGLYPSGEYDLVGAIVGTVPRRDVITGEAIREGDVIIGLPSTGLHTNGYSLARRVLFDQAGLAIDDLIPGTRRTVADTLLAVHRSYLQPVNALMQSVKVRGMAHITGGGLIDNVPRVLPANLCAAFDRRSWKPAPFFRFIQQTGKVDEMEMYRVFNMGIGYVIMVRAADQEHAMNILNGVGARPRVIGSIIRGKGNERVRLD